jgi:hypothetical protein
LSAPGGTPPSIIAWARRSVVVGSASHSMWSAQPRASASESREFVLFERLLGRDFFGAFADQRGAFCA